MRAHLPLTMLALIVLLTACSPNRQSETVAAKPAPTEPLAELAQLGGRRPVPLQPMMAWHQKQNMMDHLVVIQEVTAALAVEDWEGVAAASKRFESSADMQRM